MIHKRFYSAERKDLILSVLRSTATKREVKQYISKYTPPGGATSGFNSPLRIAILKIRDVKSMQESELTGIGSTISRLSKLGVSPVVVIDAGKERNDFLNLDNQPFRHYHRAITWKAGMVSDAIEKSQLKARPLDSLLEYGRTLKLNMSMIIQPVARGIIPIVAPVAYDSQTGQDKLVAADDVVLCLTQQLQAETDCTIEKVIFIDPLGGVPSVERGGSHVYVNLKQELQEIQAELHIGFLNATDREIHLANLTAMYNTLDVLPMTATGLITTPRVAASASSKNPLIYNVLTDRPVVSPSLPVTGKKTPRIETTILRRGVPIEVLKSDTGLDILKEAQVGRLDLKRLELLLNDSFGKTINMEHYLNRINKKVAAVIITADYEGAAIVTWEEGHGAKDKVMYLDKFAVAKTSQGSGGVADVVFKAVTKQCAPNDILWRSRRANPVNKWYFERSTGSVNLDDGAWTMFWAGGTSSPRVNAKLLNQYKQVCQSIEPSF